MLQKNTSEKPNSIRKNDKDLFNAIVLMEMN